MIATLVRGKTRTNIASINGAKCRKQPEI